jgi:hypothetical protein
MWTRDADRQLSKYHGNIDENEREGKVPTFLADAMRKGPGILGGYGQGRRVADVCRRKIYSSKRNAADAKENTEKGEM